MAVERSSDKTKKTNRYSDIIERIFTNHYRTGVSTFQFERVEIETVAADLKIALPKNIGDLLYSFRFRVSLPVSITSTAPEGYEWVINLAGRAIYRMALQKWNRILPSANHYCIKIPDATPEIVAAHSLNDEQALLAKVRYNRLIDIFLRVTAYSLQNHLRTSVPDIGQIETDEIYVGVNNTGQQFAIPVQAKGGNDQIGIVQVAQDLALCRKAFPLLTPRPVAVQFVPDIVGNKIVMFELVQIDDEVKVIDEKHYRLVPAGDITPADHKLAAASK